MQFEVVGVGEEAYGHNFEFVPETDSYLYPLMIINHTKDERAESL